MSVMPENSAQTAEQPHVALGLVPEASEPASTTAGGAGATEAPGGEQPAAAAPVGEPWSEEIRAAYPEIVAKFRDPSKMAEGYANLEQYFHAFKQHGLSPEQVVAMLEDRASGAGGEGTLEDEGREAAGAERGAIPDDPSAFLDRFAEDPKGTVYSIAEQAATSAVSAMVTAQGMWAEAVGRFPDLPKHEKAMTEVLRAAPGLVQFPDVIDRIYRMVAGGTPPGKAIEQAKAEARAEAISQVTGTTVESGRTGAVPGASGARGAKVVEEILSGGSPNVIPGLTKL